jgi:CRP/FNR family transcriptional regulator, dissimilatory nitrate respiration regulator
MPITVEELLDVAPPLRELPEATLRRIAAMAIEKRYAKGAILFRAQAAPDGLYIVLSGRVHVSRETDRHVELLHAEGAGGILGEIPSFGGGPFPATAVAHEPTCCVHLPISGVNRLLADDPAFVRFALAGLASRARVLLRRIDELTATTITSRVADHLLARAGKSLGVSFTLGMSQEALARELGTAREVIVRSLRRLVASGGIERAGRSRFRVRNADALRAIASR